MEEYETKYPIGSNNGREQKSFWEYLTTPVRKFIYNKLPAREYSVSDEFYNWSPIGREGYDPKSNKEIIKQFFTDNSKKWRDTADEYIKNNPQDSKKYQDALNYFAHDAGLAKYLQLPQRTELVIDSEYRPSIRKNKEGKYYKFKHQTPEYWDDRNHIFSSMIDFMENNYKKGQTLSHDELLNGFQRGFGIDPKKGQFMSVYDTWDYSAGGYEGNKDSYAKYIGAKPFEIYDRVYLDEYFGVDSKPDKGDYYGGYIPTITVTPYGNYKQGGKIQNKSSFPLPNIK